MLRMYAGLVYVYCLGYSCTFIMMGTVRHYGIDATCRMICVEVVHRKYVFSVKDALFEMYGRYPSMYIMY
jgi:hypothetical protein